MKTFTAGYLSVVAAAALLPWVATPAAGQTATRLFAAQTAPDLVTLSWDSIPGTSEYLIYAAPADSVVGNLRLKPPLQRLSASSRSATCSGVRRLSHGITLVAMAANGHVIQKAEFNRITPATSFAPIRPPEEVTAEVTGPTQITLSWTPVPGATAYYIGRAVAPGGLRTLCMVCTSEPRYVDDDAVPGAAHSYTVAAIFPNGKSQPAPSNKVTPGVTPVAGTGTQVASTSAPAPTTYSKSSPGTTLSSTTPTTTSVSNSVSYDSATQTTTYTTTTTICTVATPVTCTSSTGVSVSRSGSSVSTPPSTTPTTTTSTASTPTTSTPTTTASTTAPDTATTPSGGLLGGVINAVSGAVGTLTGAVSPPASVSAVSPAPASVRVTWQASPTAGVTAYQVSRRINNGSWQLMSTVGPTVLAYADGFFPTTMFASGAAWVSYSVVAVQNNMRSKEAVTSTLSVNPPAQTPTPAAGAVTPAACKLDYQRADNMWAAAGRPDGFLGTETVSLAAGQDKVFITDWTYEKQRNDGTNYYGSHLRIATNNSTRALRLQVRTTVVTSWVRLDPGKTQQFQADLMEVFCEN